MKSVALILAGVLLSATLAHAQPEKSPEPKTVPAEVSSTVSDTMAPSLIVVSGVDKAKGQIAVTETVLSNDEVTKVTKTKVVETLPGGNQVEKEQTTTVTTSMPRLERQTYQLNVAKIKFITADGKPLPPDEVWKRVKPNSVVAITGTGIAPDQAYLQALNTRTIVLILDTPLILDPPFGERVMPLNPGGKIMPGGLTMPKTMPPPGGDKMPGPKLMPPEPKVLPPAPGKTISLDLGTRPMPGIPAPALARATSRTTLDGTVPVPYSNVLPEISGIFAFK